MKIVYLSTAILPSRYANSIQVMKMCEAFARCGHKVLLIAPRRPGTEAGVDDVFGYYGVEPLFEIRFLPWSGIPFGRGIYALQAVAHAVCGAGDIVYARNVALCLSTALLGKRVVYEAHHVDDRFGVTPAWLFRRLERRKNLVAFVTISQAIKQHYVERHFIPDGRIIVAPDGADETTGLPEFTHLQKFFGCNDALKVGYVGHLYTGKGMEVIERIAVRKPDVDFHIIGGREEDILHWRKRITDSNVIFHGYVKPSESASYIQAMDICLLPNQDVVLPPFHRASKYSIAEFSSPLKLFEYMSHGKAIIASDLPVLREVLTHEVNCLMCRHDDPESWVSAIDRLQCDTALRSRIGRAARADFDAKFTWRRRAENISLRLDKLLL